MTKIELLPYVRKLVTVIILTAVDSKKFRYLINMNVV